MNKQLAETNNCLYQALLVGKEMKHTENVGKEYYALYNVHGYTVVDWVETKFVELLGKDSIGLVSVHAVVLDLSDKNIFRVSNSDVSLLYIHKKRFKRFLKKATQRNMIKG